MLAGVAGGVAEVVDADPSLIRVVWALLAFLTGGIALVVYIVMAIVVPERPEGLAAGSASWAGTRPAGSVPEGSWVAPDGSTVPMATTTPDGPRHRDPAHRGHGGLVLGLLLILIGTFFLIRQFFPLFDLGLWWPIAVIGLGVVLIVAAVAPTRRPG